MRKPSNSPTSTSQLPNAPRGFLNVFTEEGIAAAPAAGAGSVAGHTLCAPVSILVASGCAKRRS